MYKVIWKEKALESLSKLDEETEKKIKSRVESHLASHPAQNGQSLTGKWRGYYRYPVDNYRVIYAIKEKEVEIEVVEVGERNARQSDSIYNRELPQRPQARDFSRKITKNRGKRKLGR